MTRIVIDTRDGVGELRESLRSVLAAHELRVMRTTISALDALEDQILGGAEFETMLEEVARNGVQRLVMLSDGTASADPALATIHQHRLLAALDIEHDWRPHLVRLMADIGDRDWIEVMRGLHRMLIRALDEHTRSRGE